MGKLFMIVIHTVSTSSSSVQELLHSTLTDLLCHHTLQIIQYQVYVGRDFLRQCTEQVKFDSLRTPAQSCVLFTRQDRSSGTNKFLLHD